MGAGRCRGNVTNNADVLPDVGVVDGRYRAVLTDNENDKTLHFFSSQGRLDARPVAFPFDYVVRNIGIGTVDDSQIAPSPPADGSAFVFAGVQVHDLALDDANSSHVVVGHRGGTTFTVEGKNNLRRRVDGRRRRTPGRRRLGGPTSGSSANPDRTLTVYHPGAPTPTPATIEDDWQLYRGTGTLPGEAPVYGGDRLRRTDHPNGPGRIGAAVRRHGRRHRGPLALASRPHGRQAGRPAACSSTTSCSFLAKTCTLGVFPHTFVIAGDPVGVDPTLDQVVPAELVLVHEPRGHDPRPG